MAVSDIKTFGDILDAVVVRGKLKTDTATRDSLKEKINTAYQDIAWSKKYYWSKTTEPLILKAKYTTGTVTATSASDVLTGASTSWSDTYAGWSIAINNEPTIYKVLSVLSSTSIVISAPYTGSTGSLKSYILFKDSYGLFPNYKEMRCVRLPNYISYFEEVSPEKFNSYKSKAPLSEGIPRVWTIDGLAGYTQKTWETFNIDYDFWEDDFSLTSPKNANFKIFPGILTTDIIAECDYTMIVPQLSDEEDEPLIPYGKRYILVAKVLRDNFLQDRDINMKMQYEAEVASYLNKMTADIEPGQGELILKVRRSDNKPTPTYYRNSFNDYYDE